MIYDVKNKQQTLVWMLCTEIVHVYTDLFSNESLQNTALSIIEKYLTDL